MPNAFDINGRGPSTRALVAVGTCFMVVAAATIMLAIAKSKGDLDRRVRVTAALINVGDGLPERSDVKFRGVLVGQVAGVVTAPVGQPNNVHVDLDPVYAGAIPSTVTARVVPTNVFAVSSVQLVDNGDGGSPLQAGAVIPEDTSLPTLMFQTTLNKFRKVFASLGRRPDSQSVGVLATLTEATHGRGDAIRDAGRDLNEIVAELNTVVGDGSEASTISALTDATVALRDVSPELFDALDSAVAPMLTLAEKRTQLTDFLSHGQETAGILGDSFDNQTDRLINITTQLTPVVGVLADNADAFHPIMTRANVLADKLPEAWNPQRNTFALNGIISLTPYRTYVRADCPRYGELAGPSCATAPEVPTTPELYPALGSMGVTPPPGVTENRPNSAPPRDSVRHAGEVPGAPGQGPPPTPPAALPAGPPAPPALPAEVQPQSAVFGGNVGPVGSVQERDQLSQIAGAPASSATQLLLGPMVRGTTVHITPNPGGAP
ncbi:MlaD family protein [[Mycobacterium] nativiensis]|uniref:MCE family protein n=1 Tax=[Mycobacterium] nativiensis TaxID=2855503 RepID=A0ABU5XWG7_9MYCO|nr:MCE family protein [Mycolicibacter sp. MYC340]MEB3031821.1 MCE family protein [Mycolicibacter sp. MYC340]